MVLLRRQLAPAARGTPLDRRLRSREGLGPRPPGFRAGEQTVLGGVSVPGTFAGLEPIFGAPPPLPAQVDTAGIEKARQATVEVQSIGVGCNGIITGSGFPIRVNQVLTNAHVVAGTRNSVVITPDGRRHAATIVLFDAAIDVAILDAREASRPRLRQRERPQHDRPARPARGAPHDHGRLRFPARGRAHVVPLPP